MGARTNGADLKRCTGCSFEGPRESFFYGGQMRSRCPDCVKRDNRTRSDPVAARARAKVWRTQNRERALASVREWKRSHPERVRALNAASRQRRKDVEGAKSRERYRARTPEHRAAREQYRREWRQRNLEKVRAQARERYAARRAILRQRGRVRERARAVGWIPESIEYAAVLRLDPCAYCSGPGGAIDHIEALARGGTNDWRNLTASCRSCNSAKCDRPLAEFLATRLSRV